MRSTACNICSARCISVDLKIFVIKWNYFRFDRKWTGSLSDFLPRMKSWEVFLDFRILCDRSEVWFRTRPEKQIFKKCPIVTGKWSEVDQKWTGSGPEMDRKWAKSELTFRRSESGFDVPNTPESYMRLKSAMLIGCLCVIVRPMPFNNFSCFSNRSLDDRNRSSVTMSNGTQYGLPLRCLLIIARRLKRLLRP